VKEKHSTSRNKDKNRKPYHDAGCIFKVNLTANTNWRTFPIIIHIKGFHPLLKKPLGNHIALQVSPLAELFVGLVGQKSNPTKRKTYMYLSITIVKSHTLSKGVTL
jgi:hypothetical protein